MSTIEECIADVEFLRGEVEIEARADLAQLRETIESQKRQIESLLLCEQPRKSDLAQLRRKSNAFDTIEKAAKHKTIIIFKSHGEPDDPDSDWHYGDYAGTPSCTGDSLLEAIEAAEVKPEEAVEV